MFGIVFLNVKCVLIVGLVLGYWVLLLCLGLVILVVVFNGILCYCCGSVERRRLLFISCFFLGKGGELLFLSLNSVVVLVGMNGRFMQGQVRRMNMGGSGSLRNKDGLGYSLGSLRVRQLGLLFLGIGGLLGIGDGKVRRVIIQVFLGQVQDGGMRMGGGSLRSRFSMVWWQGVCILLRGILFGDLEFRSFVY